MKRSNHEDELQERLRSLDECIPMLVDDVLEFQKLVGDEGLSDFHRDILLFFTSSGKNGLDMFLNLIPESVQEARPFLRQRFWDALMYHRQQRN